MTTISDDFKIPDGLSSKGRKAAEALIKLANNMQGRTADGGGCRAFYSPKEWAERGEEYGKDSLLVVVHDGGDLAPILNMDYECYSDYDKQVNALAKIGVYAEGCTCWYTAIYEG